MILLAVLELAIGVTVVWLRPTVSSALEPTLVVAAVVDEGIGVVAEIEEAGNDGEKGTPEMITPAAVGTVVVG